MSHFEKIKEIIIDRFGVEDRRIAPAASLRDDLAFDSLDYCELEMAIEDEFNIEVPDDAWLKWETVEDVEAFVKAALIDREMQREDVQPNLRVV